VSSKIEYTPLNDVAIVHNTPISFDEFWKFFNTLINSNETLTKSYPDLDNQNVQFDRSVVREALTKYIFPLLVIDPVKPGNENLYNAEYEHRKEVFGHKFIKDFIIEQ
jgi:hypothetical protein